MSLSHDLRALPPDELTAEAYPSPPPRSGDSAPGLSPSQIAAALEDLYEDARYTDERKRRLLRALLWAAAHANGPAAVSALLALPGVAGFLSLEVPSLALSSELRLHRIAPGELRELSGKPCCLAVLCASVTGREALEADLAEARDA